MGLHLTIYGWRKGLDTSGWRNLSYDPLAEKEESMYHENFHGDSDGPSEVIVKPRLRADISALETLMQSEAPHLRRARSKHTSHVFYGFGDASGSAFGTTLGHARKVFFEYGQWCSLDSEESSNWRELNSLVDAFEGWVQQHGMEGSQVFIFTDNSTAEAAY